MHAYYDVWYGFVVKKHTPVQAINPTTSLYEVVAWQAPNNPENTLAKP